MGIVPQRGRQRQVRFVAVTCRLSGPAPASAGPDSLRFFGWAGSAGRPRRPRGPLIGRALDRRGPPKQRPSSCTMSEQGQRWHPPARGQRTGGCSSMAEHQLPKLTVRVRFPSSALMMKAQVGRVFRTLGLVSFWAEKGRGPLTAMGNLVGGLSAGPAYAASSDRRVAGSASSRRRCCGHLLFEVEYGP
jgi:hypothetical protein